MGERDDDFTRARPGRVSTGAASADVMVPGRQTLAGAQELAANAGSTVTVSGGMSSGRLDGASTVAALAGSQSLNLTGGDDLLSDMRDAEIPSWVGQIWGKTPSTGDAFARITATLYGSKHQTKHRPPSFLHELLIAANKVISGDEGGRNTLHYMCSFLSASSRAGVMQWIKPRAQPKKRPPKGPPPVIVVAEKRPPRKTPPKENPPTITPAKKRPRPVVDPATARPTVDGSVVASLGGKQDDAVRAVLATVPVSLRTRVEPWFRMLVSGKQSLRSQAASNLQRMFRDSRAIGPKGAKALREAIDGLQAQFGMRNDQILAALRVQLTLMETPVQMGLMDMMPSPIDPLNPSRDTRSANQKTFGAQVATARAELDTIKQQLRDGQAAGTLDREEAAKLYEMMAFINGSYIGDQRAKQADLEMARSYRSTQAERDAAAAGKIKKVKTGGPGTFMSAPTGAQREWDNINAERQRAIALWTGLNDRGKVPEAPKATSLDGEKPWTPQGQVRADRYGAGAGAASLMTTFVQWSVTHQRMTQLAAWRRRQKQLEREIDQESNMPVPPHAAELEKLAAYLEAQAQQEPAKAAQLRRTAQQVRASIDAAKAFWNER